MNLRMLACLLLLPLLIIAAVMSHGSPFVLFNAPSLLIVIGTTLAGGIWSFGGSELGRVLMETLKGEALDGERVTAGVVVYERMSDLFCASGLLGTLIGMVLMLQALDDPRAIGPALSVALLTLFYGLLFGELVCRSAAEDCRTRGRT